MSYRIEELIKQCTDRGVEHRGPWFDRELFAELIIKECAEQLKLAADRQTTIEVEMQTQRNPDWLCGYSAGVRKYGYFLLLANASKIKQHFGVD
jgi:hypothetical protein